MGIMVYSLLWVMQDFVHQPSLILPLLKLKLGLEDPTNHLQTG